MAKIGSVNMNDTIFREKNTCTVPCLVVGKLTCSQFGTASPQRQYSLMTSCIVTEASSINTECAVNCINNTSFPHCSIASKVASAYRGVTVSVRVQHSSSIGSFVLFKSGSNY